jgi:nitric oxide reductase subunit B
MSLTPTRRIARNMFAQTVALFIVYIILSLIGSAKFLSPHDALASSMPYHHVNAFASMTLHLTLLTGLLGGGLYTVTAERGDGRFADETRLRYLYRAWTAFLIITILAGIGGLLNTVNPHNLPLSLEIIHIALVVIFLIIIGMNVTHWTAVPTVWMTGLSIVLVMTAIGLSTSSDAVRDSAIHSLVEGLTLNLGFALSTVALGFWLLHRFSNVTLAWSEPGLYIVAGVMSLAGVLVSAAPLYALDNVDFSRTVGSVGVVVVPLAMMIFAAHSYRGLSDRNATHTLAAHWYALSLILFLLGIGVLGAIVSAPDVNRWTQGTRLTDLQSTLTSLAIIAMLFGVINQGVAEMRGVNRRITGLLPYWLVTFGVLGGGLALAGAGVVQVYLERVLSVGYLDTQSHIEPLYAGWFAGYVIIGIGVVIYAIGFFARRPKSTE